MNYRETITAPAEFDYTHKKQSGGSGQYGKVTGRITPIPAAENGESIGMEFNNRLVGTDVPSVFVPSIEKGFREAMQSGNLTGHPVQVLCHLPCSIPAADPTCISHMHLTCTLLLLLWLQFCCKAETCCVLSSCFAGIIQP